MQKAQKRFEEKNSTSAASMIGTCIYIDGSGGNAMDPALKIRTLREETGMTRKEFSDHTGIPVRTLEDWEAGRRRPPEYIPRLFAYQLMYEGRIKRLQ